MTSFLKVGNTPPVPFIFQDNLREDDMAELLGIKRWKGAVSPKDKMKIIHQRNHEGLFPLMVGDGINDAPALAAANSSASLT